MPAVKPKILALLAGTILSSPAFAAGIETGDPTLDQYGDLIMAAAQKEEHPGPGYLMAQMKWESQGEPNTVSSDSPCGSGPGSKSLGLFQVTPQCGEGGGKDMFDPASNIAITGAYKHFKATIPGCTEHEYVRMAAGGYVQDWDTVTGCGQFSDSRQDEYVANVERFYNEWYGGEKPAATTTTNTASKNAGATTKSLDEASTSGIVACARSETAALQGSRAADVKKRLKEFERRRRECETRLAEFAAAAKRPGGLPPAQEADLAGSQGRCDDMEARRKEFDENWGLNEAEAIETAAADAAVPTAECEPPSEAEKKAFKSAAVLDGSVTGAAAELFDFSCETTAKPQTQTAAGVPASATAAAESKPASTAAKGELIFSEDFDGAAGSKPGEPWEFFDAWGGGVWRDALYDTEHAKLDGNGNLVLSGKVGPDGKLQTSYLQAFDASNMDAPNAAKFGPGTYIEASIDMSGCGKEGSSSWCAFWLFDPSDPYDGDAANGTEIDIAEYTKANDWSAARYTSNNHTTNGGSGSSGAWHEVTPSDGFHTYGLDWQPDKLSFYFDDQLVWETTQGVSSSSNQAAILSIENQNNLWAPNTTTSGPVEMVVDYVKAYKDGKP